MAEESDKPAGFATFSTILAKWEPERLHQAAKDVETLADHPGFQVMREIVAERRELAMDQLMLNGVLRKTEYVRLTQLLLGLDMVNRVPEAVMYAAEVRDKQERLAAAERQRREGGAA